MLTAHIEGSSRNNMTMTVASAYTNKSMASTASHSKLSPPQLNTEGNHTETPNDFGIPNPTDPASFTDKLFQGDKKRQKDRKETQWKRLFQFHVTDFEETVKQSQLSVLY
ncbi:hypothetical protein PFLUV_G00196380 [Perca fluviatilis]|uniref:Uncharacterized protein n=1 Tax=Perca fluviatilis TaxID=8168 RepID=A0A6A5DWF2_PERFL|nr:hypothetical protein PFLUV_G00196380 [Perca fluviatilis]